MTQLRFFRITLVCWWSLALMMSNALAEPTPMRVPAPADGTESVSVKVVKESAGEASVLDLPNVLSAVLPSAGSQLLQEVGQVGLQVGQTTGQLVSQIGQSAQDITSRALDFLGVRYRRGGSAEQTGFDCSGFVRSVYSQTLGLILPHNAKQQASETEKIDPADLKPGDLVFFNTMRRAFSHVGIYLGDGQFVHAPKPGASVRIDSMDVAYWKRHFDGARRVLRDVTGSTSAATSR